MTEHKTDSAETTMSGVDIGGLLADKRAANGVSTKTAAKIVKLSSDIIEHLEANRFSDIGAAVYVRGYLGLYAKYLGLDAAQIIHLYETQYPTQRTALKPSVAYMAHSPRQKRKRHSKVLSFIIAALVFTGLLYGYTRLEPLLFGDEPATDTIALSVDSSSPTAQVITEAEGVQNLADDALKGLPISGQSSSLISDLDLNLSLDDDFPEDDASVADGVTSPRTSALASGESSETIILSLNDNPNNDNPNAVADTAVGETVIADNAETKVQTATLSLTFDTDCWLKLTDGDGKVLASNTYGKRRSLSVTGNPPLLLRTARLSAIRSATFNGQTINLAQYRVSRGRYEIK